MLRLARKCFPVTTGFKGQRFLTRQQGRLALTPLALVLLVVEATDLIFAVDSIRPSLPSPPTRSSCSPPTCCDSRVTFPVFRAGRRDAYFRYLKVGLALVLVFVGCKMLWIRTGAPPAWYQMTIPTGRSLLVVATIILAAIVVSVVVTHREKKKANARARAAGPGPAAPDQPDHPVPGDAGFASLKASAP